MAALDFTRAQHTSVGRIGQTFAFVAGAFAAWNDGRKTRKALSVLSDRQLEDIGLVRGDIDTLA